MQLPIARWTFIQFSKFSFLSLYNVASLPFVEFFCVAIKCFNDDCRFGKQCKWTAKAVIYARWESLPIPLKNPVRIFVKLSLRWSAMPAEAVYLSYGFSHIIVLQTQTIIAFRRNAQQPIYRLNTEPNLGSSARVWEELPTSEFE